MLSTKKQPMFNESSSQRSLIAIMADDETLKGFALTGIPLVGNPPNFVSVGTHTTEEELKRALQTLVARQDVAAVFIADFAYPKLKSYIAAYKQSLPCLLEIPSKLGNA